MDADGLRRFLHDMLLARIFEERAAEEYRQGHIAGFLHLYPGEEAVAVGVIHAAEPADYIVSTYREHVHALVRGVPAGPIMAELFARRDGLCAGMGGSMHLFDRERRFMGGYAIVGETFPVAIGIAYAIAMRRLPEAVICFFGDGAVNQGTFHESLNMAALWRLPVLFVCENNHYQIGTEIHRHSAVTEVYRRACAHDMPAERVDGMDVLAVHEAAERALRAVRQGGGPQLIECETYRFRGHSMADPATYRPAVEVAAYEARDPIDGLLRVVGGRYPTPQEIGASGRDTIESLSGHLIAQGHLDATAIAAMRAEVEAIVDEAVAYAAASPEPTMADARHCHEVGRDGEVLL